MRINRMLTTMAVGSLLALGACGSSPSTRFYVLESTVTARETPASVTVGLGPVQLPPYIDRDAIVTRSGGTTLTLSEFDRWAEPMQDGFVRVLAQDLGKLLGPERVERHPWGAASIDVRVPVEVLRFDSAADGSATLVARWAVRSADHASIVPARVSTVTVAAEPDGTLRATTEALSRAIGRLAAEIASEVE